MERLENKHSTDHYIKEDAYLRARKRLKELKGFYWHLFWYVAVNLFIIIMIVLESDGNFWHFGTFATPIFWGIGLGFHALSVFGKSIFFSKSWEERKIREYLEKEDELSKRRFE